MCFNNALLMFFFPNEGHDIRCSSVVDVLATEWLLTSHLSPSTIPPLSTFPFYLRFIILLIFSTQETHFPNSYNTQTAERETHLPLHTLITGSRNPTTHSTVGYYYCYKTLRTPRCHFKALNIHLIFIGF